MKFYVVVADEEEGPRFFSAPGEYTASLEQATLFQDREAAVWYVGFRKLRVLPVEVTERPILTREFNFVGVE